jgi:hypothetical protein
MTDVDRLREAGFRALAGAPPGSLAGGNRICLSAIIREENPAVVRRCLLSVRPFLNAWAVVDTGSSTSVLDTIREVLAPLPGSLVEREWPDDFAMARNWAWDLARETDATIALLIDSDDYMLPLVMRPLPPIRANTAHILQLYPRGRQRDEAVFLARLDFAHRWCGIVHEKLEPTNYHAAMPIADYVVMRTREGLSSTDMAAKAAYYQRLLRQWIASNPTDGMRLAQYGESLARAGDLQEARECFDKARAFLPPGHPTPTALISLQQILSGDAGESV